ncbi:MAG: UDP-3-O-(3-hydroxymyristoyl)glucosamine N-acyltransferase [Fibrobacterales bacterium]
MQANLSIEEIVSITGAKVDERHHSFCSSIDSLQFATAQSLSFSTAEPAGTTFTQSEAGVVLVPLSYENLSPELKGTKTLLYCNSPYESMITLLKEITAEPIAQPDIHPSAKIHDTAVVDGRVEAGAVIGPHSIVMAGSIIEADSHLEARVTVYSGVTIKKQCTIQAGAVIGSRGFGFYKNNGRTLPVPHFGGVIIGAHVTIGAQTVVAAGFIEPTSIGEYSHIDSFVQIAHNCSLGAHCTMVSQAGIAGSTHLGAHVTIGGGAQIAGHLTIGENVSIAAKSGVTRSIPHGMTVAGFPATEISLWRKSVLALRNLAQ